MENNWILLDRKILEEIGYSNSFRIIPRKYKQNYLEDKCNDFNCVKNRLKNMTDFKCGNSLDDNNCDWVILKENKKENIYIKQNVFEKFKITVSEHLKKLKKTTEWFIYVLENVSFGVNHYKIGITNNLDKRMLQYKSSSYNDYNYK